MRLNFVKKLEKKYYASIMVAGAFVLIIGTLLLIKNGVIGESWAATTTVGDCLEYKQSEQTKTESSTTYGSEKRCKELCSGGTCNGKECTRKVWSTPTYTTVKECKADQETTTWISCTCTKRVTCESLGMYTAARNAHEKCGSYEKDSSTGCYKCKSSDTPSTNCSTGYTKYTNDAALETASLTCTNKKGKFITEAGKTLCGKCNYSTACSTGYTKYTDDATLETASLTCTNKKGKFITEAGKALCGKCTYSTTSTLTSEEACKIKGYLSTSKNCSYGSTEKYVDIDGKDYTCYLCNQKPSTPPTSGTATTPEATTTVPTTNCTGLGGGLISNTQSLCGNVAIAESESIPVVIPDKPETNTQAEIVAYLITTSPMFPSANDARWVPWDKNKTDFNLPTGTWYFYGKDAKGTIYKLKTLVVDIPANNYISEVSLIINGATETDRLYYGKNMGVYGADKYSSYANFKANATYGSRLSVDNSTGLVMYSLTAAEKKTLGITADKIYVVATKNKAQVNRTGTSTFVASSTGTVTAVSHGLMGSIYEITPKAATGSIPNKEFYAIRLDYIRNATYADANEWNDMNLLHYSEYKYTDYNNVNTKTSNKISGSTDFIFKILRTEEDTPKNLANLDENRYSDTTLQLLSSKPYTELAANTDGTIYIDTKADVTQYEATVSASEIAINPVLMYTDSTFVTGFGPRTVKLSYGMNVIDIKVKSAKGSVRTYTFLITRIDNRSSDNTLSSLTVSSGSLNPSFDPRTIDYKLTVKEDVTKLTIGAKLNDNKAEFVAGFGPRAITLVDGENIAYIKVKSQTGTEKVYKLTITKEKGTVTPTKNDDNTLSSLTVSSGSLSPKFIKTTLNYKLTVKSDVTKITIDAKLSNSKSTFVTGFGPRTIELAEGENIAYVKAKSEKGTEKSYKLTITRENITGGTTKSDDQTLSSLTVSDGSLSPEFNKTINEYSVTVGNTVTKLTVTAKLNDSKAKFIDGYGSRSVTLSVGENIIYIKVKSEKGTERVYKLTVIRKSSEGTSGISDPAKDSNNLLSSLYLSAGNLTFDPSVTDYNIYVTNDIKSLLVIPEVESKTSTFKVSGGETLSVGSNKITIRVTAENGLERVYSLNVIRKELGLAVSTSKTLKILEIAGHKIDFDPDNYLYNVTVKPTEKELTITTVADNERSDIIIAGNSELTSFSDVKVKVIAEDGSYVIYDINVTVDTKNIVKDILIGAGYAAVLGLIVWAGYKKSKANRKA